MDNFPMEVEVKVNGVICHIDRVEGDWYRDNDRTVWTYCRIATTPVKVDKSAEGAYVAAVEKGGA